VRRTHRLRIYFSGGITIGQTWKDYRESVGLMPI
jgi:hypothetical protein